jgi:hypothetical protein
MRSPPVGKPDHRDESDDPKEKTRENPSERMALFLCDDHGE